MSVVATVQIGEDAITNDEIIQQHAIARAGIEALPLEAPFDAPSIHPSNSKPETPPSGNKPAMDGGKNIEMPRAIDVTTAVVQHDHYHQRHASPLEIQPPATGRGVSQPCAEPSRTLNPG
jgi:hypothetical protein